jgi:hypothetical protein
MTFLQEVEGFDEKRASEWMDLEPQTLGKHLRTFLGGVTRQDTGEKLQPTSLWSMFNSLKRRLRTNNRSLPEKENQETVTVLRAVSTTLKKEGFGNLPEKSDVLTPQQLDKMYENRALGVHNPRALQSSIGHAAMNLGMLPIIKTTFLLRRFKLRIFLICE